MSSWAVSSNPGRDRILLESLLSLTSHDRKKENTHGIVIIEMKTNNKVWSFSSWDIQINQALILIDNPSLLIIARSQCVKSPGAKWDGTPQVQPLRVWKCVHVCASEWEQCQSTTKHTNTHTLQIGQVICAWCITTHSHRGENSI